MAQTTLEDPVTAAKIKNPSLLGGAMIIAGTIVGGTDDQQADVRL